jgi:hypothetical protein
MRSYFVYQTLEILFSIVENYVKKKLQLFSHYSSFNHPNLQLLNNYIFFIFVLQLQIFFWVCKSTIGNVFSSPFQWSITRPQIPNNSVGRPKKQIHTWILEY